MRPFGKAKYIEHRERLSRKKRMELQDEDEKYSLQLDKDVVNPNQIRTIIKAFKENLPGIFKERMTKMEFLRFLKR